MVKCLGNIFNLQCLVVFVPETFEKRRLNEKTFSLWITSHSAAGASGGAAQRNISLQYYISEARADGATIRTGSDAAFMDHVPLDT